MECNKEEAIRAKGIAESKMQNKDFHGAHKIALKAQQLYNDLENISQMLMVCDVHCAADKKLFGNEMDWYAILQIEQTADEATIKKQYRKFALLLHPDKNKFPGAEAAFKLIGEAQRVLLDRGKRSLHDIKRKAPTSKPAPPYRPQQRAAYTSSIGVQNNSRNNFMGFNPQQQHMQQSDQQGSSNGRATFWTACPYCNVKYQYYVEIKNKSLICQTCTKPFIAHERSVQGAPTGTNFSQSAFPPRKDVPNNSFSKVELNRQGKSSAEQPKMDFFQKKGCNSEFASQKANGKRRRKKDAESSESCDSDSSIDSEDGDFNAGVNSKSFGEFRRRSDRHKRNVSYKENLSDDEDSTTHPKRAKGSGSFCSTEEDCRNGTKDDFIEPNKHSGSASCAKGHNGEKQKAGPKSSLEENGHKKINEVHIDSASDSSSKSTSVPELHEYPDPDFNDFDKIRNDRCFSIGQIWAVYDTLDAMPRFYARIRKVFSPGFKLRVTWLEPDPDDDDGIEWVSEDLPASCGKFRHGHSENTEDRLMFSHKIDWEKGSQKDTYKIFPRKGEIWAVFKNWDIRWKSDVDPNRKFEYEFVEILSEYTEDVGASVAYLGKVKGYVSLFCRIRKEGKDKFQIPPGELFRFSHMIPSFKLTGEERQGVPKGSFELDPASLSQNIEEIAVAEDMAVDIGKTHADSTGSKSSDKVKFNVESEGRTAAQQASDIKCEVANDDHSVPSTSTPEALEIPEPEFFDFNAEKSFEKFQAGQIWSLYSNEDGLPKYYGQITKSGTSQDFKLQLKRLVPCALPNDVIQWQDKDMPICCGRFRTKKGESQPYTSAVSFSHQLSAEPVGKKNEYTIFPRKGQVWALYRNWSAEIKHYELNECKYDVVEVQEENDLVIKVSLLEKVEGFNSVFKAQLEDGSAVTMEVLRVELLRFSHQIPAFRLTEERGGSLRGFWELDPAALPVHYFAT
ncbi:uncharacterized protein LOC105647118 [Jatropha curcas]|uniref:uncharacterized protein LOC105647118 n=1 Tax=Jatropha curcas TaxID=180498 RepID=UPI0018934EF9|nr:uncharacterized protein LOC105647118 [Jatropha curcas]XP_012088501.2 uncharacterized protein LOC105647118 [Jatropha curcas]XP_020540150.2 uncharacterized protein LOC105647118 [Jatropha curcas]XP_020540151.2 uncharacterized protein LOC105647118 [Jatropha curcas]